MSERKKGHSLWLPINHCLYASINAKEMKICRMQWDKAYKGMIRVLLEMDWLGQLSSQGVEYGVVGERSKVTLLKFNNYFCIHLL